MAWNRSKLRVRKYEGGFPFGSLAECIEWMQAGQYLWCRGKPYHPMVVKQWSLAMIENLVSTSPTLCRARLTEEWKMKQEQENV